MGTRIVMAMRLGSRIGARLRAEKSEKTEKKARR